MLAYRWLRENNLAGEYVADTSEGSEAKLMTVDEVRLLYTCYIATVIVIMHSCKIPLITTANIQLC